MIAMCQTIIHYASAPVAKGARHLAHVARHLVRPLAHGAGRVVRHAATFTARPHTWVGLACKVLPAAVLSGSMLTPTSANPPPRQSDTVPAAVDPGPGWSPDPADPPTTVDDPWPGLLTGPLDPLPTVVGPLARVSRRPVDPPEAAVDPWPEPPPDWHFLPPRATLVVDPDPAPPRVSAPEPSSAGLLLGGVAPLLFIRRARRWLTRLSGGLRDVRSGRSCSGTA
ncbi:MAG: hypothetical protein ABSC06_13670 [Rhodopila sp.]|jgi:hypothetical protein